MMRKILSLSVAAGLLVVLGQNCSGVMSMGGFSSQSSNDPNLLISEADVAWSTRSKSPEVNQYGRVTRWMDSKSRSVNLYPPLRPSSTVFDYDKSGIFQAGTDKNFVRFGEKTTLAPSVSDVTELTGDVFTIVTVIKDVVIPSVDPKVVRVFMLNPATGENMGLLVLDVQGDGADGFNFIVTQWFGGDSHSLRLVNIPAAEKTGPLSVAMRFDKRAENIGLSVNGRLPAASAVVVGAPPQLGHVARNLFIHMPETQYAPLGEFSMSDFALFKRAANDEELSGISSAFYYRALGLGVGGPITIGNPGGGGGGDGGAGEGAQLYAVHCASCHGSVAQSAKRGANLARLNAGITSVAQMASLKSLSTADRQKIVDALK